MIMQVHDELVFETDKKVAEENEKEVKIRMEKAANLSVPLVVDAALGQNWDEAH